MCINARNGSKHLNFKDLALPVKLPVMLLSDFNYELPPDRIAQRPLERRDDSRMLLLDRISGAWTDQAFRNFPELLEGGELLVCNNARVIPARFYGRRAGVRSQAPLHGSQAEHLQGTVEVFLSRQVSPDCWEALVRPGRKLPIGEKVIFGEGELEAEIVSRGELGLRTIRLTSKNGVPLSRNLEALGHVPLPPYIERSDEAADRERYQTVFAKNSGAVAAPTAGLHFTTQTLERLSARGIELCELTLDVGLGTFQPIHAEKLEDHIMHAESYEIAPETAEKISAAKSAGRKIFAIGTTAVRALEASALAAREKGVKELLVSGRADAKLFIKPGFTFQVVDGLLTNFHLPKSTLLALVSAFAGRENVLAAYKHAVEANYRFYSYGDCMWIR